MIGFVAFDLILCGGLHYAVQQAVINTFHRALHEYEDESLKERDGGAGTAIPCWGVLISRQIEIGSLAGNVSSRAASSSVFKCATMAGGTLLDASSWQT